MSSAKLSKEEYQKQKDLEAARKAGTAPPELDEEGNEINPHIPQYIVKAPWYIDTGAPTLKHQRHVPSTPSSLLSSSLSSSSSSSLTAWYPRGQRNLDSIPTSFRKGACENCGAMSHSIKECMERPRKKRAKWTGLDLQPDEKMHHLELGFDAKRDRWNGYDPMEHTQLMEEWERVEEERKKIKAQKFNASLLHRPPQEILDEVDTSSDEEVEVEVEVEVEEEEDEEVEEVEEDEDEEVEIQNLEPKENPNEENTEKKEGLVEENEETKKETLEVEGSLKKKKKGKRVKVLHSHYEKKEDDDEEDEDKYAEHADMAGQKVDMKSRQTVRNLRIREDIPKYLRNLDLMSAHYDPKTRSMRDNPNKEEAMDEVNYSGDNFYRYTGDAPKMTEMMIFAWQAAERGNDVHFQANPSQAEFLYREYLKKKDTKNLKQKESILKTYGGEEHLLKPLLHEGVQQSEEYVEYSRTGKVLKGLEKPPACSKYTENVYPQNHTSVWGSYWVNGQWGYACCHATLYNAYCTGSLGKDGVTTVTST
ncbi:mRNA splicing protein [Coelomomyces lativittatus]|nr:mRNA splicing protein [Coelomomyces lativittatus]KAJ1515130.1 mRNA splicing protein [Coelomomyces lativittatus]KAJ1515941.1 mRNA splicing protein [Coelomomyces lativittatus]